MRTDFKDHFSSQSHDYQRFRPSYPPKLYRWLASLTPQHELAWDCAAGNGQAARALSPHYAQVIATDASAEQIAQCPPQTNVTYRVAQAEHSSLHTHSVDLITVAQALHWFDRAAFYAEATRVLKAHGVLAVWNYRLLSISPNIDAIVNYYYHDIVGPYWPAERQLVQQGCDPLPKPFIAIEGETSFNMTSEWDLQELLGYLGTWSASVYYTKAQGHDPLQHIRGSLATAWDNPNTKHLVQWPLQLHVGRLESAG